MNKTTIIILMAIAHGIMTITATKKEYEFVMTTITEIYTHLICRTAKRYYFPV